MPKITTTKTKKAGGSTERHPATKSDKIIRLLKRSAGTTIAEMQKASGWQAHSIRGFLSGTVRKQMGLNVNSRKAGSGERRYRIVEAADT